MKPFSSFRGTGSRLARIALLAGALALVAGTALADGYRGGYRYGGTRFHRHYGGVRYVRPYRYYRPRSSLSFSFGFGSAPYYYRPYYAPRPIYVAPPPYVVRERVYVDRDRNYDDRDYDKRDDDKRDYDKHDDDPYDKRDKRDYDDDDSSYRGDRDEIEVNNLPPAGAYYYDTYCHQRFSNLDDYTEHLDHKRHSQTISVIDNDSKKTIRTLEFVDGYWQVQE